MDRVRLARRVGVYATLVMLVALWAGSYPLTLLFTTGPGTISVAVALGSAHPAESVALVPFFVGMSAAAMLVAVLVWLFYSASDQISHLFGQVVSRAITRLSAFFQLCIGTQILITGVTEVLRPLLVR